MWLEFVISIIFILDGSGTNGSLDLWAKSTPGNIFEKMSGDPRAIEFPS